MLVVINHFVKRIMVRKGKEKLMACSEIDKEEKGGRRKKRSLWNIKIVLWNEEEERKLSILIPIIKHNSFLLFKKTNSSKSTY